MPVEPAIAEGDRRTISVEQAPGTITLDPVAWVEEAARVVIFHEGGRVQRARFQVIAPADLARAAVGRPAEELPRLLPASSSVSAVAHHLASARALDQVFGVRPPPTGEALRRALLLADFIRAHLRRLAFLLAAPGSPLAPSTGSGRVPSGSFGSAQGRGARHGLSPRLRWPAPRHSLPAGFVAEMLRGAALAHEALEIVGGRVGLPVCAVPGGVARALDGRERDRLVAVAASLLDVAHRTRTVLHETLFTDSEWLEFFHSEAFSLPIASLAVIGKQDGVDWPGKWLCVVGPDGSEIARFGPSEHVDYLAEHVEPWSYQPFAYLKNQTWPGLAGEATAGLFRVGPLARLNVSSHALSEAGAAERQRLEETLGTPPWHSLAAGVWASLVELLDASETLAALSRDEVVAGTGVRELPAEVGGEGAAAVEGPAGLVLHAYRTDARGLVQQARVLGPATFNNAARNLAAQQTARHVFRRGGKAGGELRLIELAVAAC